MNRPVTPEDAVHAETQAAVAGFMDTFDRGELEPILALYTEDCIMIAPGQPIVRGKAALRDFWRTMLEDVGMGDVEYEIEQIDVQDADHALETTRFTATVGGVRQGGNYIVQWKREDGRLKLHRDIFTAAPLGGEA